MADSESKRPPILRLPLELLQEILSYLCPCGDLIVVTGEFWSPLRRALNREVKRLQDPHWKPPKKKYNVLLANRELNRAGLRALWGGNRFVFATCDSLRGFTAKASSEIVANIVTMELGEEYHYVEGDSLVHWGHCYRALTVASNWPSSDWPHPDWPPSLSCLEPFVRLRHLHLHVGDLADQVRAPVLSATQLAALREDDSDSTLSSSSGLYMRDCVLKSIPSHILSGLETLTMHYLMLRQMIPFLFSQGYVDLTADVLQYAKDLQAGAWTDPPYRPGPSGRVTDPEHDRLYQRWLEARGAVYWDIEIAKKFLAFLPNAYGPVRVTALTRARDVVCMQWCSWAREWSGENYGTSVGDITVLGRPRCFEELAKGEAAEKARKEDAEEAGQSQMEMEIDQV